MRAIALLLAITLTACTRDIPHYRPIAVPAGLAAPVAIPEKPDPQRATQRDVARYLIEQHQALATCNARLAVIRQWSERWMKPTAPQR